jgi:hypothetical protein
MTTKIYENIGQEIGKLVDEKNSAYGSSFAECHKILSVLYPQGIKVEQFTDALAIIRVIDKLFRIANKKDAFGESPWKDIAGYAILGIHNDEETKVVHESKQKSFKKIQS